MNKLSAPHWAFSSESGLAARPEPLIPNRHLLELTALRTPNTMADKDVEQKDSEWVRLQSTDGFSYLVRRKVASASGTIKNMLDAEGGGYSEALTRVCDVRERGIIVEKLVEYMSFKTHYENVNTKEEVPVKEFMERIPPEIVLELLLAADYQEM